MADVYDCFEYPEESNDFYEPVVHASLPPVPPRSRLPFVPTKRSAPLPAPPEEPALNYEDLEDVQKPELNYEDLEDLQTPIIPKLPRRYPTPALDVPQRASPIFREVPQRSKSPMPDAPQRAQPPVPPLIPDERASRAIPDTQPKKNSWGTPQQDFRSLPPIPPPIADAEVVQPDYEDLMDFDRSPPTIPDIPDTPPRKTTWAPQPPEIEGDFRRNAPEKGELDSKLLNNALKNLRKRDTESIKPQLPVRPEVTTKVPPRIQNRPEVSPKTPLNPLIPIKPGIPVKPIMSRPANEKSLSIADKIAALKLEQGDKRNVAKVSPNTNFASKNTKEPENISPFNSLNKKNLTPSPQKLTPSNSVTKKNSTPSPKKVTPSNSFNKKNSTPPLVKVSPNSNFPSKNTEDFSEDEVIEQEDEYIDAAGINSLQYQSYYREKFDKTMEAEFFNEDTEDGIFVIRKSKGANSSHPYTLLLYFNSRPFRLKLRFEDNEYAIGERKDDEQRFTTVMELVDHYTQTPLMLIGAGYTRLKY